MLLFNKLSCFCLGTSNFQNGSIYILTMPMIWSFNTVSGLVPAEFGYILAVQDSTEMYIMQRSPLQREDSFCVDNASPAGSGTESTYSED